MKDQINRLGFDVWADSLIVDFLENNGEAMKATPGSITTEKPDGTIIRSVHGDGKAHIVVRGYTGSRWETSERTVRCG
jgi:hypothetical protein